ncbi:MAG: NUDIX hydrolase [Lachnospiraceae bacterium]|nr:NUDIX hydrolase [Lachnospiraceae bacterium]
MKENLIRQIENYPPFNEQEEKDKALILGWIRNNENAFSRENTVAHITASAWVVNKDRSKVLMVYHNIYNSWSWLGGHADGHVKKGNYVSSHLHLNITYLLEADSEEQVSVKADENSGVMWFSPEDALEKSTEPWFVEHIYSKLIKKMGV